MTLSYIVYLSTLVLCVSLATPISTRNAYLIIKGIKKLQYYSISIFIILLILVLVSGLRDEYVGTDTKNYKEIYLIIKSFNSSFEDVMNKVGFFEPGLCT